MKFEPVMQPWDHQTEARRRSWLKAFFAWLMEMGTGKTKVCIDEFLELYCEGLCDCVLIVAPKGVYMNWLRNELPTHVPDSLRGEVYTVAWHSGGGNKTQKNEVLAVLEPRPGLRILVMNTEAFSTGDLAFRVASNFLASGTSYFALDESTGIKNMSSVRTKNIIALGQYANYRRIMSGLWSPRGPLDLYPQAEFLQKGLLGHSAWSFRARYAVLDRKFFSGRRVEVVVGYQNIDELTKRVEPWSYRVTKEDCLTLPPKLYTRRDVELTPEQTRMYQEIKEYAISMLENGGGMVSATSAITQILRLQQLVCGHLPNDDGTMTDVPSNRIDTMCEVLEEVDGKVIIWSRYRRDIEKIVARLTLEYGAEAVAQFHGGNTDRRHLEAERFISDQKCRFMVASYAGGHGNTWIVATTVIYYSNDYDLEKRAQSEDRAHRGGQTERVTYVDLVSPGTVDEKILKVLRSKIDIASTITGDGYREWLQ